MSLSMHFHMVAHMIKQVDKLQLSISAIVACSCPGVCAASQGTANSLSAPRQQGCKSDGTVPDSCSGLATW
jgi:hypothetical protein